MQLDISSNWLLSLLFVNLLLSPTHAQTRNTATASVNPTATNVALATQAVAQIAKNNTSGFLSDALNGVPGFLKSVDQVITGAVAETKDQLNKILDPELYYSYGRSPPVYPTPKTIGDGGWTDAIAKARTAVALLTNEEKANLTLGSTSVKGCSGFVGPLSKLGFGGLCLQDNENGVRGTPLVNGYAAQLSIGASWNRSLAYDRGLHVGKEHKVKGVSVALGPVVGPLGRIATGGRNWEGFSNDPYLAGALVGPTITAMQQSVIACVKHLVANEQESNRLPFLAGVIPQLGVQSVSSNLDDRTMHELYLWPFYDAIRAEPGSVMCSYNQINGSYGCQNSKIMNGLLKKELGFRGFVVSDWYALHTGIASNNAGLDMVMPSSRQLTPKSLAAAVANGSVDSARLDDQATRILAAWYRYAQSQTTGIDGTAGIDARDPASASTLLQSAVEGQVLVKNVDNALPLQRPQYLNLFGYDAVGGINGSSADATEATLVNSGLANTQAYTDGRSWGVIDLVASLGEVIPQPYSGPSVALNGTLLTGGGSGAITPTSSVSPFDAFQQQAKVDNTTLHYDFAPVTPHVKYPTAPCIVFINAQSSESWDRSSLSDDYSDNLVLSIASHCSNTIVSIHNAGPRSVDAWIDHPNVTAAIFAHIPGQESGNALVEVMYGKQSPSGRMPYTLAKQESDYGTLLRPTLPDEKNPLYPQSDFTEGLNIDYRAFIANSLNPRFAFGYGLTYTNFTYTSLQVSKNPSANTVSFPPDAANPRPPQGGFASLYDILSTVSVTVTNSGSVPAAEVAQLYVGIPGSGQEKVLRGFEKKLLQPGRSEVFSFPLRRRDLSIWDTGAQQWRLPGGEVQVYVGKSVVDIQLRGGLRL